MRRAFAIILIVPTVLLGCATRSGGPALQIQGYSCAQMEAELGRLHVRVYQLGGGSPEGAMDGKPLAVGSAMIWPVAAVLGASTEHAAEYARLKGERDALIQLARERKCPFDDDAGYVDEAAPQDGSTNHATTRRVRPPSYTLLPSGAVVADPPTVVTGAPMIPVRAASLTPVFKKTRGDGCDRHVVAGDYCWWSPPGNYSMCPPIQSFNECTALYGRGCQLGHGKVLPLC